MVQRRGRFELADSGSLFLDEIGDISLTCSRSYCVPCKNANLNDWAVKRPSRLMFV